MRFNIVCEVEKAMATAQSATSSRSTSIAVAVVFTAYMAVVFGLGLYLFSLLAYEMRQSLGFGTQTIGTVTAAAQVTFLVAAFLCPRLTHRFGEARVIVMAVIAAGAMLSAVSTVTSAPAMTVLIGSLGACAAMMVIPTVGVFARTVPVEHRSRVNGLVSSGTAYGQFAAGWLAPALVLADGWRSAWLVLGVSSIAVALAGLLALKALAPAAFVRTGPHEVEAEPSDAPLITIPNCLAWGLLAASGLACGPWQNYLSTFLGEEGGLSIALVGRLWSIIGFLGLFSGFAVGLLADRIGIARALGLSYALLASSALLVAFHSGVGPLYAAAILFGSSFFAVYGLIPAYITKTVVAGRTTAVFAVSNICLGVGTALGNVVGGHVPALFGSLQPVYAGIGAIALIAALAATRLPDERKTG